MQQPAADLSTTPAPSSGGSVLVKTTQIPLKNPVSGHRLKKVGLILVLIILGIGTLFFIMNIKT